MANSTGSLFDMNAQPSFNLNSGTSNTTSQTSTPAYQPSSGGGGLWGALTSGLSNIGNTIGNALSYVGNGGLGNSLVANAGTGLNALYPSSGQPGSYSAQYPTIPSNLTSNYNPTAPASIGNPPSSSYSGLIYPSSGNTNNYNTSSMGAYNASFMNANPQYTYSTNGTGYSYSPYGGYSYVGGYAPVQLTPQQRVDAGQTVTSTTPGQFTVNGITNAQSGSSPSVQNPNVGEGVYNPPPGTGPNPSAGQVSGGVMGITDPTTGQPYGSAGFRYDQNGNKVWVDANGNPLSINSSLNGSTGMNPYSGSNNPYAGLLANIYAQVQSQGDNYKNAQQQYQTAVNAQKDFQNANAERMAELQGNNNYSIDTQLGAGQIIGNRFASELPAYQGAVSNANQLVQNALTQQGQNYGLLNSLVGASQPYQNGYVMMSPVTGQTVNQGGTANAAFQGGQYNQAQTNGQDYYNNQNTVSQINSMMPGLNSMLSNAGINPSNITAANAASQAWAQNTSDPKYAELNAGLKSVVGQYASILGTTPDALWSALQNGAMNGQAISTILNSWAGQAQAMIGGQYNYGTGNTGGSGGYNSSNPLNLNI